MSLSTDTKHIVALSGGKDSTAMALKLAEVEPRNYLYVITPTGNELPEMFAHWRHIADMLGKPLTPLVAGGSLRDLRKRFEAGDVPQRSLDMMDKRRMSGTCRVCTL